MNTPKESQKTKSEKLYQGIGLICGRVKVDDLGKYFIDIDIEGATFWFQPTNSVRSKLTAHLEAHPDTDVYLRVYPAYSLNLNKLWFHAIRFYPNKPESPHLQSIEVNQFLLAGIWQYIPKLPDQPVMSIYRNRLKGWEQSGRIRNNHLPVRGFTKEPYRYKKRENSKEKSQRRKFYRLLVRLNPQQQAFEYVSLLETSKRIPRYIKKKRKKQQPSQPTIIKKVKQMNFSLLQKTAIQLREAGFFEGKVSGRGITKDTLSTKVQDSLSNHPEAVKVLNREKVEI